MKLALETIRVLRRFKNAILEGPPGTGKSHVVAAIADAWEDETGRHLAGDGNGKYAITLHPNTTYEEFVEGLRYDEETGVFRRKNGFLRNIVRSAMMDPESDYLVLIDEINRANVPKVFGDLLLTMESSKRAVWDGLRWRGGMAVTLPYSEDLFYVPSNIFLIGTMNTTDRSIAPLDSALRRRFGFIRVEPLMGEALRSQIIDTDGQLSAARVERSVDQLTNLNEALRRCLGPSAMLGHSYLFGATATEGSIAPAYDPLEKIRSKVAAPDTQDVFWLEARRMYFGNYNQLDLPDAHGKRKGIVDSFFPASSNGVLTSARSTRGTRDLIDIHYEGTLFRENFVSYNKAGSNYRLYYQGQTDSGMKFASVAKDGRLQNKIHVWLRKLDNTLELVTLESSDAVIRALQSVSSSPDGWWERTGGQSARSYGSIDKTVFKDKSPQNTAFAPTPDSDTEYMLWRYAILPQLIDTASQVGATELLASETRNSWLEAARANDAADRWRKFDDFLASLSLAITDEGYGLTRGLSVVHIPVGAKAEYSAPEISDEPDIDRDDDAID